MTSYYNPLTGQTIQPAEVGYQSLSISTNTTLAWPVNGNNTPTTSPILEVTATVGSLTLSMPPASQVSNGQDILIRNVGSNTFTVANNSGSTLTTIAAGVTQYLYVTDNTTTAGTWATFTFGTGTSSANAATLAGYGLQATGSTLNQSYPLTSISSSQDLYTYHRANLITWTGGTGTLYLPSTSSVGAAWFCIIRNSGSGTLTLGSHGTDTFDGASTQQLNPTESAVLVSNGSSGYNSFGYGRSSSFSYTMYSATVTGGTVTLTSAQAKNVIQSYSGTLTSNQIIVLPSVVQTYFVSNTTTGAYTLTLQTVSGAYASFTLPQNTTGIVVCDGNNVFNAVTTAVGATTSAITIPVGAVGSPTLNFSGNTTTGLYLPASSQVGVTAGGTQAAVFSSSQAYFPVGIAGGTF